MTCISYSSDCQCMEDNIWFFPERMFVYIYKPGYYPYSVSFSATIFPHLTNILYTHPYSIFEVFNPLVTGRHISYHMIPSSITNKKKCIIYATNRAGHYSTIGALILFVSKKCFWFAIDWYIDIYIYTSIPCIKPYILLTMFGQYIPWLWIQLISLCSIYHK